jgi:hypothetical protein
MDILNLPPYPFKTRVHDDKTEIFDIVRKKYVVLTPEEWVRQHFLHFLMQEKKVPATLIAVEKTIMVNRLSKRTDIVVYDRFTKPLVLVECKSPIVPISQEVFDQVVRYNIAIHAGYIVVTNGMEHYCCKMDYHSQTYAFIKDIPEYSAL